MIPLSPYVVASISENMTVARSLLFSVALTLVALFVFGFIKGRYTGTRPTSQRVANDFHWECCGGGGVRDCAVDWRLIG